jgi:hypothetical protein
VIAFDAELAVLPVATFGADHPTTGFVRDGLGDWVARVNADLAGCNDFLFFFSKKKNETSCQLLGLLHPVHRAIREQLKVCQGAAEPLLQSVTCVPFPKKNTSMFVVMLRLTLLILLEADVPQLPQSFSRDKILRLSLDGPAE